MPLNKLLFPPNSQWQLSGCQTSLSTFFNFRSLPSWFRLEVKGSFSIYDGDSSENVPTPPQKNNLYCLKLLRSYAVWFKLLICKMLAIFFGVDSKGLQINKFICFPMFTPFIKHEIKVVSLQWQRNAQKAWVHAEWFCQFKPNVFSPFSLPLH